MVAMRMPIPAALREDLSNDPYMKTCIIDNFYCRGRIEWHHNFTWAGKRQNELWSILPLCTEHHAHAAAYKGILDRAMIERIHHFHAEEEFRTKYPKSDLLPTLKVEKI